MLIAPTSTTCLNTSATAEAPRAPKRPSLAGVEHVGFRMKDVVWDTAILYPPGVQWGQAVSLLVPPVVKFQAELTAALH